MGAEDTGKSLFIKQHTTFTSTVRPFEGGAYDKIGVYTTSEGGRFEIAFNEVTSEVFQNWDTTNLLSTTLPEIFRFTDAVIMFFNHNDVASRNRIRGWLNRIQSSFLGALGGEQRPLPPTLIVGTRASQMLPNAPNPNIGGYEGIKLAHIDLLSGDPKFLPLKALQLLVPDLLEADHPVSLIPVFDGGKHLVLAPTKASKVLIKPLVLKAGETYTLGRESIHTGCIRNKGEMNMLFALSEDHIDVHFHSSESIHAGQVTIKRLGHTTVRLEKCAEQNGAILEVVNLDCKGDEGTLHPGSDTIHLYAGAENFMTYKVMTLPAYLESVDNGDSPMDIISPFLQLQGIHSQTTELLLSEIKRYKRDLAAANRAAAASSSAGRRMDSVGETRSGDDEDHVSDLSTQLGDHLSFLENNGEDIYGAHRTQAF
jgi:hypothetical protein